MLTTLALGVLSSLVAEFVSWLNKKLSGTPLHGDGAFLFAAFTALVISSVQVWHSGIPLTDLTAVWVYFTQVWAVSQVVFLGVIQLFKLDVQDSTG